MKVFPLKCFDIYGISAHVCMHMCVCVYMHVRTYVYACVGVCIRVYV